MSNGEGRAAHNALHQPVLADVCLDLLAPAFSSEKPILIDCTLGMGGHSEAALTRFPQLTVIGIDRDPQAIALASERLAPFGERFRPVQAVYDAVADIAATYAPGGVAGILMDLGVSSLQLDATERGFSYSHDAPLDMRMDQESGITAAELLAQAPEKELVRILRRYGEERFAPRIAREIVRQRAKEPLTRTGQLVDIVRAAIPAPARRTGGNPAKRTFQALRIAVNDELGALERALPAAISALRVGGRIVVESYQSLEDKIVKQVLGDASRSTTPRGLPVELAGHEPVLRLLTRGARQATPEEIAENPRSASVRLRAAEKMRDNTMRDGGAQ
ncbi:16S rRNA methyltransferase [Actinobaculum suis]|uniref:16S rRNA (cytosine(1402)-N(4))-methyltransferase RsmH n=1 Tax=Actinobaculum suis TaxID=1657 RepID=UPI00066FD1FB|nr:16S rRNA (cytosine(1402)-N(4))-methyltransferase RsmH [Actinobaculum suis]KMY23822.1 16S rRNA methyltransferase [Actinobaculum suis]